MKNASNSSTEVLLRAVGHPLSRWITTRVARLEMVERMSRDTTIEDPLNKEERRIVLTAVHRSWHLLSRVSGASTDLTYDRNEVDAWLTLCEAYIGIETAEAA